MATPAHNSTRRLWAVALAIVACALQLHAYNFTAVSESGTGYESQTWFYCGSGNDLDQTKIKNLWNEGKRITSVAYTDKGWFVVMAKNTKLTMQTYHYDSTWPTEWITEKERDGYHFTSIGHSDNRWMLVMSQNSGYTSQTWMYDNWSALKSRISSKWSDGYKVTSAVHNGKKWLVVMSKGTKYSQQEWMKESTYAAIRNRIKAEWDKGWSLQSLDYGGGEYLAMMVKYTDGHKPAQSFVGSSDNISGNIDDWWKAGKKLAHIGGGKDNGNASQPTYASNGNSGNGNGNYGVGKATGKVTFEQLPNGGERVNLPDGGYRVNYKQKDGSILSYEAHPCIICHGTGQCTVCYGTGGRYANGIFYPCNYCCGTNKCRACQGNKVTTLTSTYKNGVAVGYGNDGRQYIGTADDGNSRSSSRDRSRNKSSRSRNKSNDYVETIEYAPNYTGLGDNVWCEKCQSWGSRHSHIRKRVH